MSVVIQAQEAVIKTATVQVKALTISGRQVTLSVFRQLQDEPLVCLDGTIVGTPWGRVNYFWGRCLEFEHLHVVWEREGELRRACVSPSHPRPYWFEDEFRAVWEGHLKKALPREERDPIWYPLSTGVRNWRERERAMTDFMGQRNATKEDGERLTGLWEQHDRIYRALNAKHVAMKQKWQESYGVLSALDQLFIAV